MALADPSTQQHTSVDVNKIPNQMQTLSGVCPGTWKLTFLAMCNRLESEKMYILATLKAILS